MTKDQLRAVVTADNDQDKAHAEAWFREATTADLIRVWQFIQRDNPNPVAEIVCRLAQLKFGELIVGTLPAEQARSEGSC